MKGVRQGEQKGFARAVSLQLQLRFGPVPEWAQERLGTASEEQLIQWLGSILTASRNQGNEKRDTPANLWGTPTPVAAGMEHQGGLGGFAGVTGFGMA